MGTMKYSHSDSVAGSVHCKEVFCMQYWRMRTQYENFKFNSNFSAVFWNHQQFFIQVITKETVKVFTQLCCLIKLLL